jgi:hypothetical protein
LERASDGDGKAREARPTAGQDTQCCREDEKDAFERVLTRSTEVQHVDRINVPRLNLRDCVRPQDTKEPSMRASARAGFPISVSTEIEHLLPPTEPKPQGRGSTKTIGLCMIVSLRPG